MPHALELDADQGGITLGPLPDRVRIGSGTDCDVILAPRVGAPALAVELRRDAAGWTLRLPGDRPHPCRIVRGDGGARRVAADDRLREGEILEITGPAESPRLKLVRTDLLPPIGQAVASAPPADAAPSRTPPRPSPVVRGPQAAPAGPSPVVGGRLAAPGEGDAAARSPVVRSTAAVAAPPTEVPEADAGPSRVVWIGIAAAVAGGIGLVFLIVAIWIVTSMG